MRISRQANSFAYWREARAQNGRKSTASTRVGRRYKLRGREFFRRTSIHALLRQISGRPDEISGLGVGLSIDDFGVGYSSLAYLNRFSVEALKIDRSFMQDVPGSTHNTAIVQAIIALASTLNLKVVAEGVETTQQWQFLAEHGCSEMQGYVIAKPLPPEVFMEFIQHWVDRPFVCHFDRPTRVGSA